MAAVAIVGADAAATRAAAIGAASAQADRRRVYLGDLLGAAPDGPGDDAPGISDMIRFGISLGRVAVPSPDVPGLFTIAGGAETPLSEDVLSSPRWRSLGDQVGRTGGLLLLAAPAVPGLGAFIAQLDGVLLLEGTTMASPARVLGQVFGGEPKAATARRVPPPPAPPRRRSRWWTVLAGAAVLVGLVAVPPVRGALARAFGGGASAPVEAPATPVDLSTVPERVTSDAAWSAELRYLNSRADAVALVAALRDSFPAVTLADVASGADSLPWYRVVLGAFSDSVSAENFLAPLRSRGMLPASGGAVSYTPYALLVDSASSSAMARLRVTGYLGRGLPAYALHDSLVWRIYVGAFTETAGASRLRLELDSLNIQSALVVRAGSTP